MAVQFQVIGGSVQLPDGVVNNNAVSSTSGQEIAYTKLHHLHKAFSNFDLAIASTPAAREEIVFTASTACTVRNFRALLYDTGTSTSVTFDLKKNGVSILSAVITITHGTSDRAVQTATLSSSSLAAGDVLSIALAVSSSTGAQGPFAWVEVDEIGV